MCGKSLLCQAISANLGVCQTAGRKAVLARLFRLSQSGSRLETKGPIRVSKQRHLFSPAKSLALHLAWKLSSCYLHAVPDLKLSTDVENLVVRLSRY